MYLIAWIGGVEIASMIFLFFMGYVLKHLWTEIGFWRDGRGFQAPPKLFYLALAVGLAAGYYIASYYWLVASRL